ncbi:MAG: HEAT repeat domain-containing protein, partial [Polyangiales bacterium]
PGPGNDSNYDADDPGVDDDGDDAKPKPKEKTCEGYGPATRAFQAQLYALRTWVGSQPLEDDDDSDPPKTIAPERPMPLVGVDHDARWTGVVQLWSQGDAGAQSIRAGLSSADKDERLAALVAAWGAQSAVPVVPDLLRVVRGKDARERAYALEALRHAGTPSAAAVPAIVDLIATGDAGEEVDDWATSTLGSMGAAARSAGKPLVAIVRTTKDPLRKTRALEALRALGANAGDVLSELVELLRSDDAATADGALAVLRAMRDGAKPVLPALITVTKDPNAAARERACLAIAAIGKGATDAIEPLKERLTDTDEHVRQAALIAYAELGPASAPMLEPIRTALFDTSPAVRTQAARTLGAMGPAAAKAAPFLGDVLADPVPSVQEAAATTLGGLGPKALPALPKLVALLEKTTNDTVRRAVAGAIVEVGPDAAQHIPKVVAALEKSGAWYLPQTIERMGKTMKKAAAPHLGKLLEGKPEQITRAAIVAIGNLGKDGASEVPKLSKLMEKAGLSSYVFTAIGNIGESASAAIDPILEVLGRRNDLRNSCLGTLSKLGAKAVAPLTKLMTDPKKDKELRLAATRSLLDVGPKALTSTLAILETLDAVAPNDTWTVSGFRRLGKDATGKLVTAAKDKRPGVKRLAIIALGYLPPEAAKDAIPALLTLGVDDPAAKGDCMAAIARYGKATATPILNAILADDAKKKLHEGSREMLTRFG